MPVGELEGYSCQLVVDEALDWLKEKHSKNKEQPFFLYVAFHEPHEPVASPKNMVDQYNGIAENHDEAQYFANVTNLDAAVGKLLKTLKSMKLSENTLIIFTSDNGPETLYDMDPARGDPTVADPLAGNEIVDNGGGFRVAGIMHWPTRINAGQVSAETISALDFFPTFCNLAGAKVPKTLKLDGTSFIPVIEGRKVKREKPLLWAYYSALNERRVAMRDGKEGFGQDEFPKDQNNYIRQMTRQAKGATLSDFQIFDLSQDIDESKTSRKQSHRN